MSAAAGKPRLLIVGPPGSGKGTQAAFLAERFDIPAISTGDIFRANIKEGTALGKQVQAIVSEGGYVPDSLTNEIVRDRLHQPDAVEGFLLDGYPRNLAQVLHLDEFLEGREESLDAVIALVVPREESLARLTARAAEQGRADDTEEAIATRLGIYERETAPILDVYGTRGIVDEIDGVGSLEAIEGQRRGEVVVPEDAGDAAGLDAEGDDHHPPAHVLASAVAPGRLVLHHHDIVPREPPRRGHLGPAAVDPLVQQVAPAA